MLGILVVKSAVRGNTSNHDAWQKQIIWAGIGIVLMLLASAIDYRAFARQRRPMYWATVFLLVAVLFLTPAIKGSHRWFLLGPFSFQPSEFAKVLIAATLAGQLVALGSSVRGLGGVVPTLLHIGLPCLLILKEPDLGTCLCLVAIWFALLFFAGTRAINLILVLLVFAGGFTLLWKMDFIKDYQKSRLTAFMSQSDDPQGESYQVTQSKIAIGSGGLHGKGLFHGPQGQLQFIPEQHTDFIFTVVGEELGFGGSAATIILFGFLLWRGMRIALMAEDLYGKYLACAITAVIGFQVVVNVGMTLGIMPITGIPLPFMSYGGSSIWAFMLGIGLMQSVHRRAAGNLFS